MRSAIVLSLLPLALAVPSTQVKREHPAPVIKPRNAKVIEGKYIIKMSSGMKTAAMSNTMSTLSTAADFTYKSSAFNGFAGSLTADELEAMQNDPDVEYIEQDAIFSISEVQEGAPWGISRLSSQEPGGNTYTYDSSAGEGTCAYIIDTGIEADHPDFEGRAEFLENFTTDGKDTDGHGHGTHVAGTIGSKTYGVAKKTKLFGVKVLDSSGDGTTSAVLAGMGFVGSNSAEQDCPNGVVVNMSLGGSKSQSINSAAAAIVGAGLFLAVAAGNEAVDASNSSPASEESVCTVGATTSVDSLASYSNFGPIVDILAPGSSILSTWIGNSTNTISGTSMATPHIAGLAAYLLGMGATSDPVELCSYISSTALDGVVSGVPNGTVNELANNGQSGSNTTVARRFRLAHRSPMTTLKY